MGRMSRPRLDEALDDRRARALLTRLGEPGDAAVVAAVEREGAAAVVDRLLASGRLGGGEAGGSRAGDLLARADGDLRAMVEADLARVEDLRGEFLVPGDASWPTQVDDLGAQRPLGLWVLGGVDLRFAALRSVAVVGARSATRYGESVAARLAEELAARGWTVVSGGAYGIDAAAHRGALAAGRATVSVLACGADRAYPSAHSVLLERIAEDGVIASESPPGAAPTRWRFLERNRLIAALAGATVVVEAAWRSGALSTARHAEGLGRPVGAVPGPVSSAASAGCHRILRSGAVCVTTAAEIVELLRPIGNFTAPDPFVASNEYDGLDPDELRVWETLHPRTWMSVAQLSVAAGLPEAAVRAALGVFTLDARASARYDESGRQLWRRATVSRG